MRPDGPREPVAGPDAGPQAPYPIRVAGPVIKGYGRGSKELGIPTANIPADGLSTQGQDQLQSGVYYGVASLDPRKFRHEDAVRRSDNDAAKEHVAIFPCVLSIGYNPFYKNTVRSVEIHLLSPTCTAQSQLESQSHSQSPSSPSSSPSHKFYHLPDFYDTPLRLLILGFIRPEYDYIDREALTNDIRTDCDVARRSLARDSYACYLHPPSKVPNQTARDDRQWLRSFHLPPSL